MVARRERERWRADGCRRAALVHWPGGDGRVPRSAHGVSVSQEVLYRKWRPGGFAEVAGQDPITTTLRNAVAAGSPAHAYLFTGPRGTGKTSTGRILAKAVNCEAPRGGEPDNACISCLAFNEGRALDLIELDAASNRGIDEVRALRESVGYAPNAGSYKVYLVDEVHMLTDAAFNALLKTLEEPPAHVIFVLATTEPHRIPPTISSRCQRFDFRRASLPALVERIGVIADGEGISVAEGGPELIARQAGGSFRDAVNLLDQLAAYHGSELDLEAVQRGLGLVVDDRAAALARAAVGRDLATGLSLLSSVRDDGIEVRGVHSRGGPDAAHAAAAARGRTRGDRALRRPARGAASDRRGDPGGGDRRRAARPRRDRLRGRRLRRAARGDRLRLVRRRAAGGGRRARDAGGCGACSRCTGPTRAAAATGPP